MPSRVPRRSPDDEQAFAHRLQLWRLDCGNPSYQQLERLMGRRWSVATIHGRLTSGHNLDRAFVRAFVEACHRYAGRPGEPDLDPLFRHLDILLGKQVQPQWIGSHVSLAATFQARAVDTGLRDALRLGGTVVIRGNGGVGKTQLAAEIAQSSWTDQRADLVVWVLATSRDNIVRRYAEAAKMLGVATDQAIDAAAERFLAWLAEPHGRQWLVVLDDLSDPADLHGLWPPSGSGNTVVTTRRRDAALAGPHRTMIELDVFDPAESVAYLTDRLGGQSGGADELCRELGHLPLALAQAAAYILDRRLDCSKYLARFRTRRLTDLEIKVNERPDGYAAALSTTWRLSIETADSHDPAGTAGPLLDLAAWLDPNGIPAELFWSAPVLAMLTARRGRLTTPEDAWDGVTNLERLSLSRLDDEGTSVRVHQLEQRVVRESSAGSLDDVAVCAADGLLAIWPEVERDASFVDVLRNNTEVLFRRAEAALTRSGLHQVLFRAGNSLPRTGLKTNALAYWEHLLPIVRNRLGEDHADTLTVLNNLAWAHGRTGNADRALSGLRDLLPIRVRVLGPDHVNTLATRHGIAVWQAETGDLAGSAESLRELVRRYERVLGPDHRDTLNTRLTLIDIRARLMSPTSVLPEFLALVDDYHRLIGGDHPETLDAELLLASELAGAGQPVAALERTTALLPRFEKVLGQDHIDTLRARFLAADFQARAGDRDRAARNMRILLEEVQRHLDEGRTEMTEIHRLIDRWSPAGR
nr:tetratricopeptide repeat protein [uncultured Actinoplanes sp.]